MPHTVMPAMTHRRAVLTMLAVTLMWSIAGVVTRHLEAARSFEVTFWRSAFTVLALAPLLAWLRGGKVLVQSMRLFHCGFMQAYGMTETTGLGALLMPEDHDPGGPRAHLLRSCGKAPGALQIKLLGSDGAPVAADGDVGEIWIHGPSIMKGYWQDPDATRAAIDADGWLRTGDMAYQRDGYLFIHDRAKDMIISGGENVYPAEVENVLMQCPGIRDVAVIGVPSERWGETVKAIITAADPALREADVLAFCAARLARYKCPTSVDWVDAIPRNPSGKILKNQLREPYWVGKTRRVG